MQKRFRKWAIGIVAFLLCFSLAINIHCVILLMKYRQIYQAPPVWVTESGEYVGTSSEAVSSVAETYEAETVTETVLESTKEEEADTSKESESQQTSAMVGTIVYITKSGTKFHRDGCSSLSKSRISIPYEDAVSRGFEPCGRCAP